MPHPGAEGHVKTPATCFEQVIKSSLFTILWICIPSLHFPVKVGWVPKHYCPACWTYLIATRFWVVVICPIIKCPTVLEFSFILFDLCLFITICNFILNYVPIVTFWIFTYHKIWILLIIFCFIWNYWIIYFLNMFGSVLECCELTGVSLLWPWLIKWK